jgi:hypothetical protein
MLLVIVADLDSWCDVPYNLQLQRYNNSAQTQMAKGVQIGSQKSESRREQNIRITMCSVFVFLWQILTRRLQITKGISIENSQSRITNHTLIKSLLDPSKSRNRKTWLVISKILFKFETCFPRTARPVCLIYFYFHIPSPTLKWVWVLNKVHPDFKLHITYHVSYSYIVSRSRSRPRPRPTSNNANCNMSCKLQNVMQRNELDRQNRRYFLPNALTE